MPDHNVTQMRDALIASVRARLPRHFPVRVDVVGTPASGAVRAQLRLGSVGSQALYPVALITQGHGDPFGPMADDLLGGCRQFIAREHRLAESARAFWAAPWYVRVWRAWRGNHTMPPPPRPSQEDVR